MSNSFNTASTLKSGSSSYKFHDITVLKQQGYDIARLPFSMKVLLENLLRHEDGNDVTRGDIEALLNWDSKAEPTQEIAYTPARVVLQDFTGVPAVVDLAAMRDAMKQLGGDPKKINPLSPAELVIDHSVMVDNFGTPQALEQNSEIEFQRNRERYQFLRWGQTAFSNFAVVPPDTGIVHQINLEMLARVAFPNQETGEVYPDTCVGTDSHTTMVNGLGVLGWGVGGIEAEAAMLGQAVTMLIPQVVGFKLTGKLAEGATATDLVLTVTEMLRNLGVVGKFVEFYGDGLANLTLADRATISNMAPEYGATCGIFPIDEETLRYLKLTGRTPDQLELVEKYAKAMTLWREDGEQPADYSDNSLSLDLGDVQPSLAGPTRPQDRILLSDMKREYQKNLPGFTEKRSAADSELERLEDEGGPPSDHVDAGTAAVSYNGTDFLLRDGAVVIAAITSCTNTSNPAVLMAAGLLARNAIKKGLRTPAWVKTSLAPGSLVVTEYLKKSGLMDSLETLGFHVVGYGCTTCIGNSGPLPEPIGTAVQEHDLIVSSVLSGNRNFEGRIHGDVRMNFLASPPLVVAYALAGNVNINLSDEPLGQDSDGNDVFLKDIWPSGAEIQEMISGNVNSQMFINNAKTAFDGDERWKSLEIPKGEMFAWDNDSTYIQNPPYFTGMSADVPKLPTITAARCLAKLGDSITTDHISPAGAIGANTPGGQYLQDKGIKPMDFNSYGSRRGNHQVMMRGTFANVRLRNQLAPDTEGGWTRHQPSDEEMFIYDAAMKYQQQEVPLVILGGKEYGTGSSRDWAAKGTILLGVKAVIVESYERIHRSNLVGMGVLPLQFSDGESHESLGLTGKETYDIDPLERGMNHVQVRATSDDGKTTEFDCKLRIDTPKEWDYYQNGGILHYVLRQLVEAG
ncbi:MAG: aconitate hydratase [Gammaproteobacteria bacterium]|jgi:aconitate hydratase